MPQTTEPMGPGARAPQLERENPHATTREKPARQQRAWATTKDPTCRS